LTRFEGRFETGALLLRTVAYGESDLIVTLLTEQVGKVGVAVRGGRKSSKRVGGALEPFHGIAVTLEDRGRELVTLSEARIVQLRARLASSLEAMDAAGTALRWARHLFPARTPEPEGYAAVVALLDRLDAGGDARAALAAAGLKLLAAVGYGLDFERCVKCGKACPSARPAKVDPSRGGLVCRACGGAALTLDAEARRVARALANGEDVAPTAAQSRELLGVIDQAMSAHAGFER
jgi:DNA repair protein RecO (recombination protein O)